MKILGSNIFKLVIFLIFWFFLFCPNISLASSSSHNITASVRIIGGGVVETGGEIKTATKSQSYEFDGAQSQTFVFETEIGNSVQTFLTPEISENGSKLFIHTFEKDDVVETRPQNNGKEIVADIVYDFSIYEGYTQITEFEDEIVIEFGYTDDQVASFEESSLRVYYWDQTSQSWILFPDFVLDQNNNTIQITTRHFTLITVMGNPITPSQNAIVRVYGVSGIKIPAFIDQIAGEEISNYILLDKSDIGSVKFSWKTDILTRSELEYGRTKEYEAGALKSISYDTSHEMSLKNLSLSDNYYYRITVYGLDGGWSSMTGGFFVEGRGDLDGIEEPGVVPSTDNGRIEIVPEFGGATTLKVGEKNDFSIFIPAKSFDVPVEVFVDYIKKGDVELISPYPEDFEAVGEYVYYVGAKTESNVLISRLSGHVRLNFTYTDDQTAGLDEESFRLYYFDKFENKWIKLKGAKVDIDTNTVSADLDVLTYFVILGRAVSGTADGMIHIPIGDAGKHVEEGIELSVPPQEVIDEEPAEKVEREAGTEEYPGFNLSLEIPQKYKNISVDGNLVAKISIIPNNLTGSVNVSIKYIVYDPKNNQIYEESEIMKIKKDVSYVKLFDLSNKLSAGEKYRLHVALEYGGNIYESEDFFNTARIQSETPKYSLLYVLFVGLAVIAVAVSVVAFSMYFKRIRRG